MELNLIKHPITIETERLSLQSMNEDDLPFFYQLQSDESLMKYIGPILTKEAIKQKFAARIKPWDGDQTQWLTLKIIVKSSQNFAGTIGFRLIDIESERAEIGYLLTAEHQGKGYMVEAARAIINFLFHQVNVMKIEAHCCAINQASWQVMEKLGMQREGHFKAHSVLNQQRLDDYSYGLLSPNVAIYD
ncbi:GNAT family N-acetyltransferase [Thalassotalea sp. G2M2-11]|uniref:GNAT family N-acetyltransferase n=1 Tax=Thalassotalea sp. G2M2-11 TaxID=2787627 RepID=UPI0019CF82CD|nr:GNAT family N-acetyltransferase [Thalassotalea sp. G2M2-11]